MGKKILNRMCLIAIFVALFVTLCLFRIRIGNFLEISFGTVVIAFTAITFSPIDALAIAVLGEGINQLFLTPYGISPTTPLWILPVVLRAAIIVVVNLIYKRKGDDLFNHKVILYFTIAGAALIVSLFDTGLLFLDGIIMGYPVTLTWLQTLTRFLTSQANVLVTFLIIIPLRKATDYYIQRRENI